MGKVKRIVRGAARKTGVAKAVRGARGATRRADDVVFGKGGVVSNTKKARRLAAGKK